MDALILSFFFLSFFLVLSLSFIYLFLFLSLSHTFSYFRINLEGFYNPVSHLLFFFFIVYRLNLVDRVTLKPIDPRRISATLCFILLDLLSMYIFLNVLLRLPSPAAKKNIGPAPATSTMRGIIDARSLNFACRSEVRPTSDRYLSSLRSCRNFHSGNSKLPAPYNETCNTNEGKGVRGEGRGERKLVNPGGSA